MTEQNTRLGGLTMVDPHLAGDRFYESVVASAGRPLESAPVDLDVRFAGAGRMWSLTEWLDATWATSLVVLVRGTVVREWYADGLGPETLFLGASATKSLLTQLVGAAVRAGKLTPGDRVPLHVPELEESGYGRCTVAQVLSMTTGVDWVEDHRDPSSPASRLLACFLAGATGSRSLLTEVGPAVAPGSRFEYNTGDSQVLDWVRERATGIRFTHALREHWAALGCTSDAAVVLEEPGGVALAGGGLAATARDWARMGRLQVDGTVEGPGSQRLLDRAFVEAASVPSAAYLEPGRLPSNITTHAGFGWAWWPLETTGRRVTADGSRGQFVYVDRERDVVVVRTSRWPYDDWLVDRQARDLCYLALPAVADAAFRLTGGETSYDKEVMA